jgi:HPt (histidine-containing phosphotransfer) domain-containing protein
LQRSKNIVALDRFQKDLQGEVNRQALRADRITREMMVALSHTVDAKDHYTKGHSERVATYAAEIGRRMGKPPEEQRKLYEIGLLHDIGKIGISEEILNKTERLSETEFAQIKTHTMIGHEILKGIQDMQELSLGARSHHERFDGRGYPDALSGNDIPEVARIICVADCYDAMTSTRTYSVPKPQEKVRAEFVRCSGYQFDPEIARVMIGMIDEDTDYSMTERHSQGDVWKNKEQYWDNYDSDEPLPLSSPKDEVVPMENSDSYEWLNSIPELDPDLGIENCGTFESLVAVTKIFHQTARSKADEIENLWNDGDTTNYTIKVHALKSSARVIGARVLSDMAKELEDAGRSGNLAVINSNTPILLKKYRELDACLSSFDEEAGDKPELTQKMRDDAMETIQMVAGAMDYGVMEQLLKDLKGHAMSEEDEKLVCKLENKMMKLDWDGILELVNGQV